MEGVNSPPPCDPPLEGALERPGITINITLNVSPAGDVSVETGNGKGCRIPAGPARPAGPGVSGERPLAVHLEGLPLERVLAFCRVRNPAVLLEKFPEDRIREVCLAALSQPRRNIGGWVASALTRGWAV